MNDVEIFEFEKNAVEKVKVILTNFKGKKFLNLRVFYNSGNPGEENWIPTKKGLTLSEDLIPELKKAIELTEEELKSYGK